MNGKETTRFVGAHYETVHTDTGTGETRYDSGESQTKYQYTGQYSYVTDFGLHYYGARWYDSQLGRFAQADTIISGGAQGMDRYAYANNNAMKYTDPSGHGPCWAGKNYKCNLNAGQLASLLGNKNTEKFAMNYIASNAQSTPCYMSGGDKDKYCDLRGGGFIDSQHFGDGMYAGDQAEDFYKKHPKGNFSELVYNLEGNFSRLFSVGEISSREQLKAKFIYWYAYTFQPAYESDQYKNGGSFGKSSAFRSEDIPSAVLGAYYRLGLEGKGHAVILDTDRNPTFKGWAKDLFVTAMTDLDGYRIGSGPGSGASRDCMAEPCGTDTARNPNPFLKIPVGSQYWNILWPGAPLAQLNIYLSDSTTMGPR
jgi:RHS repeat-associated protein